MGRYDKGIVLTSNYGAENGLRIKPNDSPIILNGYAKFFTVNANDPVANVTIKGVVPSINKWIVTHDSCKIVWANIGQTLSSGSDSGSGSGGSPGNSGGSPGNSGPSQASGETETTVTGNYTIDKLEGKEVWNRIDNPDKCQDGTLLTTTASGP